MKKTKRFLLFLCACLFASLLSLGFVACATDKPSSLSGTYYSYENGQYDKSSYLTLNEDDTWIDDEGVQGTYKIENDKIVLYYTENGDTLPLFEGVIEDGMIYLDMLGATACYRKEGKAPTEDSSAITGPASILSVDGASIQGEKITMVVDYTTDSVSLANKVVCAKNSVWKLYYDKLGQMEIPTKIATSTNGALVNGDNIFYIVVTSADGTETNVYDLIIHRSYAVPVNYFDGENLLKTETVYTGYTFETSYTPTIEGYTFHGWNYTKQILWQELSLYADKTANTYTVTYDVNKGDALSITEQTVTYDSNYSFTKPTRTGYTFLGWYYKGTKLTDTDGNGLTVWNCAENVTAQAKWEANDYTVTLKTSALAAGTIEGAGEYNYEQSVTIAATTNLGYTWLGWYNGDTLLTNELTYTFTMQTEDVTYTAKWSLAEEMQGFTFTSTASTCTIIGVEDKTITSITIPDIVTEIGSSAFFGCAYLTKITIPDSVTLIERKAFSYCTSLPSITLPNSVTGIYTEVFSNCTSLTSVTLGNSVTRIGEYAFYGCTSLTSITLGNSITEIGDHAFHECTSLTSISLPNSLTSIGTGAFYCTGLTSIAIPSGVTKIGEDAFFYCINLTNIAIPDTLTSIGDNAFYGCSIEKASLPALCLESILKSNIKEVIITSGFIGENAFKDCTNLKSVIIGDAVTEIGDDAFYACTGLTSATLGNSVARIGERAFYCCINLTSITIPNSAVAIGSQAFAGCSSLTSLTISDGVTYIHEYAFQGCSSLTSVTIPNSVTLIGDQAFSGCTSLTSIAFQDTSTWYRTSSYYNWVTKTGGTEIDVTSPSNNASMFKNYVNYYLYKL